MTPPASPKEKQNYAELPQTTLKKQNFESNNKLSSDDESQRTIGIQQINFAEFKETPKLVKKITKGRCSQNNKFNLSQEKIVELKKAFNELDVNRDGVISRDELKYMFQTTSIDFKDEDLDHFFTKHDSNADDKIQFEEFISAMLNGDLKV